MEVQLRSKSFFLWLTGEETARINHGYILELPRQKSPHPHFTLLIYGSDTLYKFIFVTFVTILLDLCNHFRQAEPRIFRSDKS